MVTQKKATDWHLICTVAIAVATCFAAWIYFQQMGIMRGTLDAIQENNRVAHVPVVSLVETASFGLDTTEEKGVRWQFPYYVVNMNPNIAFKPSYYHEISIRDSLPLPDDSLIQHRYESTTMLPNDTFLCGYDVILRQQVTDAQKAGKAYHLHLFLWYEDAFGNRYQCYFVLKMEKYTGGDKLAFSRARRTFQRIK